MFFDYRSFFIERGMSFLDEEDDRQFYYTLEVEIYMNLVKYADSLIESIQNNDESIWNNTKYNNGDTPEFKLFLTFIEGLSLCGFNEEQTEEKSDDSDTVMSKLMSKLSIG